MRDHLKLSDITLVCEEECQFKAHRILAANSNTLFFISVQKSNMFPFSLSFLSPTCPPSPCAALSVLDLCCLYTYLLSFVTGLPLKKMPSYPLTLREIQKLVKWDLVHIFFRWGLVLYFEKHSFFNFLGRTSQKNHPVWLKYMS